MIASTSGLSAPKASALAGLFLYMIASLSVACNPYEYLDDESQSLGPVDPVNFPAANLGAGGNRMRSGQGAFEESPVWQAGMRIGYFRYPLPMAAIPAMGSPVVPATAARVYAFDSSDAAPVPDKNNCTPLAGWAPNPREDAFRYDQQGNVFSALPSATYNPGAASATTYMPIVAEFPLNSAGQPCQAFKSRKRVDEKLGPPMGSGRYLAWLIIDPGAAVRPIDWILASPDEKAAQLMMTGLADHPGIGTQKWGWFNRYLLAYLDGGYIPTQPGPMGMGQVMVSQRLYLPRSPVMAGTMMVTAQLGQGLEVIAAKRGQPGYSPLCEVMTYDLGMPMAPAALPKDAAAIEMLPPIMVMGMMTPNLRPAMTRFVFCLQVR